jgi:hypothetical protein
MRWLALAAILAVLAIGSYAHAAPYLIANIPPAADKVTSIKGSVDGVAFTTPYKVQSGGVLIYDLAPLSVASHSFTLLRAVNVRGESSTVPFTLPALPAGLAGVRQTQ